jgi:hypothetical protein
MAKPIAGYFQRRATNHDKFRKICIAFAQQYHTAEQLIIRRFYDKTISQASIVPLNEAKAVDMVSRT